MNLLHTPSYWQTTKPPPGCELDLEHPLARGLVGCWLMNEGAGGRVLDLCGRNHGTLSGTAKLTHAGVLFDGTNDARIVVSGSESVNINVGTLIAEVVISAGSASRVLVSKENFQTDRNGVILYFDSSNNLYWELSNASTYQTNRFTFGLSANRAYTVGASWDGAYVRGWLNGVVFGSPTAQTVIPITTVHPFSIARDSVYTSYKYGGEIRKVVAYSRALSAAEIQELYRAPYQMVRVPIQRIRFTSDSGLLTSSLADSLSIDEALDRTVSFYRTYPDPLSLGEGQYAAS